MPKVHLVQDMPEDQLAPTKDFPLACFPFPEFNPVQSRVLEFYDEPINLVAAAPTSAGKTACAEMMLAHELRERGGKGMYIGPLRALGQQKLDDWRKMEHDFRDLNISICTGDYRLTPDRRQELMDADLILMTPEMLNSRLRNIGSEHSDWLYDIGTLIIDEGHSLTFPDRGDRLEVSIMKMTASNPDCRLVLLSATMPNVEEIGGWLTALTDRDTYVLESEYRPVPLRIHYKAYDDSVWGYDVGEREKVYAAMRIVQDHPDDKFLIFVHTKKTCSLMCEQLKMVGIEAELHNANVSLENRLRVESQFCNSTLRVLVATSTLSQGLNLPARRCIVLGIQRGLQYVENYEVEQMTGRAGRPQYDPKGDAYVLLPYNKMNDAIARLSEPTIIESVLVPKRQSNAYHSRTLAFHITNEIHQGEISTVEDITKWYERSLAHYQGIYLEPEFIKNMVGSLTRRGIIKEEDGNLTVTGVGRVASMFYHSPFDVADLLRNFNILFQQKKEMNDLWIAMALAHIESARMGIVSNAERDQLDRFDYLITPELSDAFVGYREFSWPEKKVAYCYYLAAQGKGNAVLANTIQALQWDAERIVEVLVALDGQVAQWKRQPHLRQIAKKFRYGCDWGLLDLCAIPGIGRVKAQRLRQANLKTPQDVATQLGRVKAALRCSDAVAKKVCERAKEIA